MKITFGKFELSVSPEFIIAVTELIKVLYLAGII